jgi:hypothetical protein
MALNLFRQQKAADLKSGGLRYPNHHPLNPSSERREIIELAPLLGGERNW